MQNEIEILRDPAWSALPWLVHGFSTRTGGTSTVYAKDGAGELNLGLTPADDRERVMENRRRFLAELLGGPDGNRDEGMPAERLMTVRQVHGTAVLELAGAEDPGEEPAEADGMMTGVPGVYLAIQTADCVPVLLVDVQQRVVAAFHAGWRGTLGGIVERGVAQMGRRYGSSPQDMQAVIGPCIGSCCYAVGEEVVAAFSTRFGYAAELLKGEGEGNGRRLNLVEANRRQLLDAGLRQVRTAGGCTQCDPATFFSHRGSGGVTGRMMNVVGIRRELS